MNKSALGLIGGGAIALSLSLVLGWLGLPHVLRSQIKKASRLTSASLTFDLWKEPSYPIYMKIHLFNVVNPDEVKDGGKPIVKEMGPYTYLEKRKKTNIRANLTLIYEETRTWFFQANMSKGTEEDTFTHLNIPFVSSVHVVNELDEKMTTAGVALFQTSSVRDFLFDGVDVQPILDILKEPATEGTAEVKIPETYLDGKFGLYEGRNGSNDGTFEVKSGAVDYREYGQLVEWNNLTSLNSWKGKNCNEINGTDGVIFPPFMTRRSVLRAYMPNLCRTVYIVYDKDEMFKTVPVYRFTIADKVFQGKKTNPDNACFCTEKDETSCDRNGILIMSGCSQGAPILMSMPHFYGGQQSLIDDIDGLKPEEAKHKIFMDIEPVTGFTLRAAKRLQFNIDVSPKENMPTMSKLKKMVFPVMWVEESYELPDDWAKLFSQLYMVLEILDVGKWVLVFASTGCLVLGILCGMFRKDTLDDK